MFNSIRSKSILATLSLPIVSIAFFAIVIYLHESGSFNLKKQTDGELIGLAVTGTVSRKPTKEEFESVLMKTSKYYEFTKFRFVIGFVVFDNKGNVIDHVNYDVFCEKKNCFDYYTKSYAQAVKNN